MGTILDSRSPIAVGDKLHGNDGQRGKLCASAFLEIGFEPIPLEPLALQARVLQFSDFG